MEALIFVLLLTMVAGVRSTGKVLFWCCIAPASFILAFVMQGAEGVATVAWLFGLVLALMALKRVLGWLQSKPPGAGRSLG